MASPREPRPTSARALPEDRGDATRAARVRTIALISPSGHGNLGDEAILASTIENIRRRLPDARFVGITLNPDDTRRRFGIDAFPLAAISRPEFGVLDDKPIDAPTRASIPGNGWETPVASVLRGIRRSTRSVLARFLKKALRLVLSDAQLWSLVQDVRHMRAAYGLLRDVDLICVAGGGQLDEYWGGPWGQPYALFKWSTLARFRGIRLFVISVGYGTLNTRLGRFFVRRALSRAAYRSYRDDGSRRLVQRTGFAHDDPVVPDLAFGLDREELVSASRLAAEAGTVCLSPMAYLDPGAWPDKDPIAHEAYLARLADIAATLVAERRKVVLVSSDGPDRRTVAAVHARLANRLSADELEFVSAPASDTVDRFLAIVAGADLLIASRLHGVLLSLVAGTPTLALSYDRKVSALMENMGLSVHCIDIEDFDPAQVVSGANAIDAIMVSLRSDIALRTRELAEQVQGQFNRIVPST